MLALTLLLLPAPAFAQRIALVIGNAAYADRPLRNPVNDAQLMQATLRELGFQVQMATDVDRRGLLAALRDFEARARGAEVALFYFAGHGAQVGGANYLVPVNAPIRSETDVPDEALDAASVLRRIEEGRARVGLVILDACRDNPYPGAARSSTRGLARMSVPTGTIVAYATAPGSTADDGGSGPNGLYTGALARYLATPGLDIKEVFDRTAQEVERLSNGRQRPREEIGLRGRFVLRDGAAPAAVVMAAVTPAPAINPAPGAGVTSAPDPEVSLWELAVRRDNVASYEAYLRTYPKGRYAAAARAALDGLQTVLPSSLPAVVAGNAGGAAAALGAPPPSVPTPRVPRVGEVFKDCAECPEMVVIPAGRFSMGSPDSDRLRTRDESPQRWVDVPRFAIAKYEVTQGEWLSVMGSNPSGNSACGMNCPVENVSWNDAQEFVRRLSQRTGQNYRLPSEAEWEYAARAGTATAYAWGDLFDAQLANNGGRTVQVGRYPANAFGLYDMHGNVWEWVQDVWHANYAGAPSDGSAWMVGGDTALRVLRGGSLSSTPQFLRSAFRHRFPPIIRSDGIGLRIARNV